METIKADLKAKKAELKKLDTELAKLEEQKAEADANVTRLFMCEKAARGVMRV